MGRKRTTNKGLPQNITRRGNYYYVRLVVDGQERWKSAGKSIEAAQIILGRLREDAALGKLGLPKAQRMTVSQWLPSFMRWSKAHKRSWWRDEYATKRLEKFFGGFYLQDVTKQRAEAYARDRLQEVKAATVNRELSLMRRILSYAVEQGKLERNPLLGIKMLPEGAARQPILEPEDEERLTKACMPWLGFMIRLALATGCRQGEILALRWKHIDFDLGVVHVLESAARVEGKTITGPTKSGESRRIPLNERILGELRSHRGLPEGWVVVKSDGIPPARTTVTREFRQAATKEGLGDLVFHDLRHVAATRLLAAGATLPEVQTYLGHKTLTMARRYAHTSWTRLQHLVEKMS